MFIGDRRTKHSIRAFRSPADSVVIPEGAILRDVRTSTEPGYSFPVAMRMVAWKNPSVHILEYQGETFYCTAGTKRDMWHGFEPARQTALELKPHHCAMAKPL
jgi:hypothetical protein